MSSSNENINIDELIEDLQSLASYNTPTSAKASNQRFPVQGSTNYFPHPPSKKSPTQHNPKAKFAVLPDEALSWESLSSRKSNPELDDKNIDDLLSMLSTSSPHNNKTETSSRNFDNDKYSSYNPNIFTATGTSKQSVKSLPEIEKGSNNHFNHITSAAASSDSWDEIALPMSRSGNHPVTKPFSVGTTAPLVSSGPKSRCTKVVLGGTRIPRGVHNSAFSKSACDQLLCSQCNFRILFFLNFEWDTKVEYMFFRNNMPNVEKLSVMLLPREGSVAYCCQCHWISEKQEKILNLNQMNSTDPKWICAGHYI